MAAGYIQDICPDPAAGKCSQVQHRYIHREAGLSSQSHSICCKLYEFPLPRTFFTGAAHKDLGVTIALHLKIQVGQTLRSLYQIYFTMPLTFPFPVLIELRHSYTLCF